MQNRFRSRAAWATAAALLMLCADTLGLWQRLGITSAAARGILDAVLAVCAAFGIFNDPTNGSGF
jgi:uncharacterized membrane protein